MAWEHCILILFQPGLPVMLVSLETHAHAWHNHMHFENCSFYHNEAYWGAHLMDMFSQELTLQDIFTSTEYLDCGTLHLPLSHSLRPV